VRAGKSRKKKGVKKILYIVLGNNFVEVIERVLRGASGVHSSY